MPIPVTTDRGTANRRYTRQRICPGVPNDTGTAGGWTDSGVPGGNGGVEGEFAFAAGIVTLIWGAPHEGQNVVWSSTAAPQR
ncbi:MAG TPA: hypothetical protein VJA94_15670 [Candidatus Angelobacter sp.]